MFLKNSIKTNLIPFIDRIDKYAREFILIINENKLFILISFVSMTLE